MTPSPLIIVGAGIAGLWTALHARDRDVIVITGAPLGQGTSTGWAQGGVAAALSDEDSPERHARDTIEAGAGLVDEQAAYILAESGPIEIKDLLETGAPFERDENGWSLSREAAHSIARVARVKGDQAGAAILQALIKAVKTADHITVKDKMRVEALLPASDGGCAGVLCRDHDDTLVRLEASDTVLATGSIGGLYAVTTTPWTSQGDGLAMAAKLGAVIRDPEFVQFHPTAINIGRDPAPLATEALRGEGAILINAQGKRFMPAVHDSAELAPRDVVARAVHRQNQAGQGAYLDAREAIGADFPDRFPAVFAACMSANIDPRNEPIPVAPATHYHMGGIETDLEGRTAVAGLWAVGECACTGVHGANRLASNSLLDGLVFGRRAARAMAHMPPRLVQALHADPAPRLPAESHHQLRQIMARQAGVERDSDGLACLIETLDTLKASHGPANALIAARFVGVAAMLREESRGGHFRRDFPHPCSQAKPTRLTLADIEAYTPLPQHVAGHAE